MLSSSRTNKPPKEIKQMNSVKWCRGSNVNFLDMKPYIEAQYVEKLNHTVLQLLPHWQPLLTQIPEDLAGGKSATREMTRRNGPDDREHDCDLTAVTSGKSEQGLDKGTIWWCICHSGGHCQELSMKQDRWAWWFSHRREWLRLLRLGLPDKISNTDRETSLKSRALGNHGVATLCII